MAKKDILQQLDDLINELDSWDEWELDDPNDQAFWDEFFQMDELLAPSDELDPPKYTIRVLNHQTGSVKTFSPIYLKSIRKKIEC